MPLGRFKGSVDLLMEYHSDYDRGRLKRFNKEDSSAISCKTNTAELPWARHGSHFSKVMGGGQHPGIITCNYREWALVFAKSFDILKGYLQGYFTLPLLFSFNSTTFLYKKTAPGTSKIEQPTKPGWIVCYQHCFCLSSLSV